MTTHVQCPHCGQAYALTEEQVPRFAGNHITCADCGESFLVSADLSMTGALATAPSTYETQPEATAAAFPTPTAYAPAPRTSLGSYDFGADYGSGGSTIAPTPSPPPAPVEAAAPAAPSPPPLSQAPQPPRRPAYTPPVIPHAGVFGPRDPFAPSAPAGQLRPLGQSYGYAPTRAEMMYDDQQVGAENGWATASIVCAVLGLIVPVLPGLLALLFGLLALGRMRRTQTGAGFALGGIVVGAAALVINGVVFVSYVVPAIQGARASASTAKCMDNLNKLAQGMRAYASANGGRFPDRLESAVVTKDITPAMLICPEGLETIAPGTTLSAQLINLRKGRHMSYVYVGGELTLQSSAECVLMYEPPGRHGNGMNVLFADGRVQTIGAVEAAKAINQLNHGINPPWTQTAK